ncbi:hypothetical protein BCR34DRAFT_585153 [Clohesyomyces aquaticus]|uniref:Uncharacterized protein n=1 Tax=Clohesyomyces aquaticus TaxID=1231657 RepID=A0A1Y1ZYD7_9PLEO|nr:hypothetical protein BCR34DRAFT_585153 [Clohesyomyces aquaticus]
MAPEPNKGKERESPQAEIRQPAPQRPLTFLQRLSSIIPSMPHHKSTPKKRSKSAPDLSELDDRTVQRDARLEDERAHLKPKLNILILSDHPCPYDSTIYTSFPSIERPRSRCLLCGLGSSNPIRAATSGSASHGRRDSLGPRGSPCRHLANVSRPKTPRSPLPSSPLAQVTATGHTRVSFAEQSREPTPTTSTLPEPRRKSLPKFDSLRSIITPSPKIRSSRPPTRHGPLSEEEQSNRLTFDTLKDRLTSTSPLSRNRDLANPKLHHIHGLPRSRDYPYIHKHEVRHHLASGGVAAARRPHTAAVVEVAAARPESGGSDTDYSETVFYPRSRREGPAGLYTLGSRGNSPEQGGDGSNRPQIRSRHVRATAAGTETGHSLRRPQLQPLRNTLGASEATHISRTNAPLDLEWPAHYPRPSSPLSTITTLTHVETVESRKTVAQDSNSKVLSHTIRYSGTDTSLSTPQQPTLQNREEDAHTGETSSITTTSSTSVYTLTPRIGVTKLELRGGSPPTTHPDSPVPRLRGGAVSPARGQIPENSEHRKSNPSGEHVNNSDSIPRLRGGGHRCCLRCGPGTGTRALRTCIPGMRNGFDIRKCIDPCSRGGNGEIGLVQILRESAVQSPVPPARIRYLESQERGRDCDRYGDGDAEPGLRLPLYENGRNGACSVSVPGSVVVNYNYSARCAPGLTPRPRSRGGGGAASRSAKVKGIMNDEDMLPAGLFYLAGDTKKRMTVGEWRAQRPERRMGRAMRWAVLGERAGRVYEKRNEGRGGGENGKDKARVEVGGANSGDIKDSADEEDVGEKKDVDVDSGSQGKEEIPPGEENGEAKGEEEDLGKPDGRDGAGGEREREREREEKVYRRNVELSER